MSTILLAVVLVPAAMLFLLTLRQARHVVLRSLGLAPLPALLLLPAAWESQQRSYDVFGGWRLVLDQPGALMLAASAILWSIGGFAASAWLKDRPGQTQFSVWWLLTLAGSLGVFVAGDIVSFYLLYAAASLPAFGLIVFNGDQSSMQAGKITLGAALIGEAFILTAFVLLAAAAPGGGLVIQDLVDALPTAPQADAIMAFVILGFGFKIGLVPLHGWMPQSYAAGPLVATAVLSGATSKAGMIGLIRFLPLDAAFPEWGYILLVLGLVSAFYGAIIGLTQANPRSVLAYSSVSQLGQMAAVLGAGLATGNRDAAVMVAFYAVYHVLTKGGLFFALGTTAGDGRGKPANWSFVVAAALALGFAGLPLTGGALAKLAVKPIVGDGAAGVLLTLAAVGSTLLMLHFLRLLRRGAAGHAENIPRGMTEAWAATAVVATCLPWWLFADVTTLPASYPVGPDIIAGLLWPIGAGAALGWGLMATGILVPRLPAGDILGPCLVVLDRTLSRVSAVVVVLERTVRQWPVATFLLVAVVLLVSAMVTN